MVSYRELEDCEDDDTDDMVLTECALSQLMPGEVFVMEANPKARDIDPIAGIVAVERMYRVLEPHELQYEDDPNPFYIDGVCHVQCERV